MIGLKQPSLSSGRTAGNRRLALSEAAVSAGIMVFSVRLKFSELISPSQARPGFCDKVPYRRARSQSRNDSNRVIVCGKHGERDEPIADTFASARLLQHPVEWDNHHGTSLFGTPTVWFGRADDISGWR